MELGEYDALEMVVLRVYIQSMVAGFATPEKIFHSSSSLAAVQFTWNITLVPTSYLQFESGF